MKTLPSILVVDDDAAVLDFVEFCLSAEAYSLTFARDAEEGIQRFPERHFDLVITDRHMPGMGGEELAAEIKRRAPTVPVILISGHPPPTMDETRFDLILAKPLARQRLIAAVETLTMPPAASQR